MINDLIRGEGLHGSGTTSEEIEKAEEKLGLKFSKEYREYLSEFGIGAYDGHEFTGISDIKRLDVVTVTEDERKNNPDVPRSYYVIEQANYDGIVIWQDEKGIVYESFESGSFEKVANSILQFIEPA